VQRFPWLFGHYTSSSRRQKFLHVFKLNPGKFTYVFRGIAHNKVAIKAAIPGGKF
jgi:hypothetical protein